MWQTGPLRCVVSDMGCVIIHNRGRLSLKPNYLHGLLSQGQIQTSSSFYHKLNPQRTIPMAPTLEENTIQCLKKCKRISFQTLYILSAYKHVIILYEMHRIILSYHVCNGQLCITRVNIFYKNQPYITHIKVCKVTLLSLSVTVSIKIPWNDCVRCT